jgi:NAD+ synthetase|nr:MAG TPA: NAD synthase [Crassvirales sp.]
MSDLNYEKVFETLVNETGKYLTDNHIQAMVLGISGGIDSTVTAAICYEVGKQTGIPLIGRSLPIKNKKDEYNVSGLVGRAFCDDFKVVNLYDSYLELVENITYYENPSLKVFPTKHDIDTLPSFMNPVAKGNIQARLRMIYLYNLASVHKGIVISTDNQTEYQLGFWTLHGDVGDFNPLFGLWKTEVYKLAEYIKKFLESREYLREDGNHSFHNNIHVNSQINALDMSISLTPTDGLGISNSDLEQIGAKSYQEVDDILQEFEAFQYLYSEQLTGMTLAEKAKEFLKNQEILYIDPETIVKVMDRHVKSEFKRKNLPVCIQRNRQWYEQKA